MPPVAVGRRLQRRVTSANEPHLSAGDGDGLIVGRVRHRGVEAASDWLFLFSDIWAN